MLLKDVRKNSGLTQKELAEAVSSTQQMISALENGEVSPSVAMAKKLAEVLKINWTEFFE